MQLAEAEAWLASLINVEKMPDLRRARLSLEPVRRLLREMGNPERELRIFHIAGSKGKGSVALFAEALLRAAGRRTGAFTSPHLVSWVERFRIDGREVAGERLAEAVARIRPIAERLREEPDAPSFFDVTTALALTLFAEAGVEAVLLEVGLGGRLDSTNVVAPEVTCVTSIELEHTDKLGDTLAAIAGEKAGIAKPGVPMLMAPLAPDAARTVEAHCARVGAPLVKIGEQVRCSVAMEAGAFARVRIEDGPVDVTATLGTPGRHQATNAAVALAGVRRLGVVSDAELRQVAEEALRACRLPARVEIVSDSPLVVIDGAHTEASARALRQVLDALARTKGRFVLSVSAGKDLAQILAALLPHASEVIVTRADPHRSLAEKDLAAAIREQAPDLPVRIESDPLAAVREARRGLASDGLLCATGSIYLAGIARAEWIGPSA